ncbi:MAG: cysteine synthase family protein [Thermomicrobiales bacterium]
MATGSGLTSIIDGIGNTPAVWLDRLTAEMPGRVLLKLEYLNPSGSIKDRAARQCVLDAEAAGMLKPGMTVIELTSGNMGIGLAMVCALRGYRMVAVMSEGNSPERRLLLRAFGAEIDLVPQVPGGVPGKVSGEDLALVETRTQELVAELGAWRPNQFTNPSNPRAHELGTGAEIWEQSSGTVSAFTAIVGTGGTFIGAARALKARNAHVHCVAVEPEGAQAIAGLPITASGHTLQGAGYAMIPPLWDQTLCDGTSPVDDDEALRVARDLARGEGVLAGFSTGANVAAALRLAAQGHVVGTVACDSATRYASSNLFSPA